MGGLRGQGQGTRARAGGETCPAGSPGVAEVEDSTQHPGLGRRAGSSPRLMSACAAQ